MLPTVKPLTANACWLCSAGAKLVLLVFKKYVVQLDWRVTLRPAAPSDASAGGDAGAGAGGSATPGAAAAAARAEVEAAELPQSGAVLHFLESACEPLQVGRE